jgi:hypothetical protein
LDKFPSQRLTCRITPATILTLGMVWLACEFIAGGPYSVLYAGDNSEIILPGLIRARFLGGLDAAWDRFSASGSDRVSLSFNGWIDVWLFHVFPGWLAYGLRVTSQIVAAVLAVYYLARRTFEFAPWPSVFCAFAYASFAQGMLINASMAYQVAILVALTYVLDHKRNSLAWLALIAAVLVTAETAYFSRLIPFTSGLLVAWFLFIDQRTRYYDWLIIVAVAIVIVLLRSDNILALAVQSPLSHLPLVRYQPTPREAVIDTLQNSFLFASIPNTACTLLLACGVWMYRFSGKRMKGTCALLVLGIVAPVAAVAAQSALLDQLPFLRGYNFLRFGFIAAAVLPFAGGYGVQAMTERLSHPAASLRRLMVQLACVGAGLAPIYSSLEYKYVGANEWLTQGTYVQNYESPVLRDLARRMDAEALPIRAEAFQLYPAYLNAYGIETAAGYQAVFLRRYYEYWGKMVEPWLSSLDKDPEKYAHMSTSIAGPGPFRGDRLMLIPEDHKPARALADLYHLNMLSLANVGYFVSRDRLTDDSLELIHDSPQPWSALSTAEKIRINIAANFHGREYLYVYRNRNVLPRIFSVSQLQTFNSVQETIDAVARSPVSELRSTALVTASDLPPNVNRTFTPVMFQLTHYLSDAVELAVQSDGDGLLVVTNSFSPFWQCEADGKPVSLFPVYHAFWGLAVPAHASRIRCAYHPPSLSGMWRARTASNAHHIDN